MTTWTKTPPTDDGFYWMRHSYGSRSAISVVQILPHHRYSDEDEIAYLQTGQTVQAIRREGYSYSGRWYEFWPVRIEEPPSGGP